MLISIIIPVYNVEKYLSRCVDSILSQSVEDWELILVDDGSNDSSLQICEEYAKKDARIKAIHQENAGPSAARNKGIELARGEYISFLDADDWFEDWLYVDYSNAIQESNYDIIFQGFIRELPDEKVVKSFSMNADTSSMSKEDIICTLYKNRVFGWSWCKIFRREIIEKHQIRFDETLRLWEDELFTIQFLHHAKTIKTLDCHNYHYIHYDNSLMQTLSIPLTRLRLSEIMNKNLIPIANAELTEYITDRYNRELKYSMLMACMNKSYYECDKDEKRQLIEKYYTASNKFTELRKYNALRSKLSYYVAECILATHNPNLIINLLGRIG